MERPCVAGGKTPLRRWYRQRRAELLVAAQPELLAVAARELPLRLAAGLRLGIYWPLAGEADLTPLAEHPQLSGRLALPRVAQGQLRYRPWQPGEPLRPDDTGIPAPSGTADLEAPELGLLLAPALACDRQGIRLGYGGGWFDRLRSTPPWRAIPALAVLPAGCLEPQLPQDPWDVPFDGWLTERGLDWLRAV